MPEMMEMNEATPDPKQDVKVGYDTGANQNSAATVAMQQHKKDLEEARQEAETKNMLNTFKDIFRKTKDISLLLSELAKEEDKDILSTALMVTLIFEVKALQNQMSYLQDVYSRSGQKTYDPYIGGSNQGDWTHYPTITVGGSTSASGDVTWTTTDTTNLKEMFEQITQEWNQKEKPDGEGT